MAAVLRDGDSLPLNLSAGMIVAFKSDKLDLIGIHRGEDDDHSLEFFNKDDNMTLCIIFRRGHDKVFFNDMDHQQLYLEVWGVEQSVRLDPADLDKWRSGVTISVHDCSTRSSEQYQILFDLTTVLNFRKKFLGPATYVVYRGGDPPLPLSDTLRVSSYKLDDLPLAERQAMVSRT